MGASQASAPKPERGVSASTSEPYWASSARLASLRLSPRARRRPSSRRIWLACGESDWSSLVLQVGHISSVESCEIVQPCSGAEPGRNAPSAPAISAAAAIRTATARSVVQSLLIPRPRPLQRSRDRCLRRQAARVRPRGGRGRRSRAAPGTRSSPSARCACPPPRPVRSGGSGVAPGTAPPSETAMTFASPPTADTRCRSASLQASQSGVTNATRAGAPCERADGLASDLDVGVERAPARCARSRRARTARAAACRRAPRCARWRAPSRRGRRSRGRADTELLAHAARVVDERVRHVMASRERARLVDRIVEVDADEAHAEPAVAHGQRVQIGRLIRARRAPRGPEVEHRGVSPETARARSSRARRAAGRENAGACGLPRAQRVAERVVVRGRVARRRARRAPSRSATAEAEARVSQHG